MKRLSPILTVLFLVGLISYASADVKTFNNPWGNPGFNLISQNPSGVEIVYSIKKMDIENTVINGETMQTISIPGVFLPNNEGAPNLPGMGRLIAIPQGASVRVEVLSVDTETLQGINLAPAPKIPLENDDSPLVYNKDLSIYGKDTYYPDKPVMVSEPSKLRGVDYVALGITPFQYNPSTKELVVYKNLKVRVDFIGGNGHFGEDRLRSRYWEPILEGNLLNYSSLPKIDFDSHFTDGKDEVGYEYIIIYPDDPNFAAWADTLKNWRTLQGIKTETVNLSDIGGNNSDAIENYINNAYNTWDIPPVAVLLLSDYQNSGKGYGITAPVWNYMFSCVSDNFYADVDGNNLPDIALSRITAQNNTQLATTIGKLLEYERTPPTDPGFYNHPVTAGGWQTERWFILCTEIAWGFLNNVLDKDPVREYAIYSGTPGSVWSSNQNTSMVVDYFGPNGLGYIPATPSYLNDWGGNASRINNDLNSGAFMLLHRDHGSETGWGEPDYSISDLSGLNNNMYPFVFSINCLTGKFNYGSTCFAEAFHRMNYGALGLIAASETSFSFVNDTYVWGMLDGLWPNFDPGYGSSDMVGSWDLRPAFANVYGKYYLQASNWPYNPENKADTYYLFHHHGDAFTTMYSEIPQQLNVSHPNILFSGFNFFTVTADEGAVIALTVDGEIIGTAEGTGSPVDVPIIPQNPGGTLTITVTLANHYRYQQEVDIIPPEGYGVINGYITDLVTGDPLEGMVTVINRDPQIITHCNENGYYYIYVPADTLWQLRAEYTDEYLPSFAEVSVAEDDTVRQDFALEPKVPVILRASFGNPQDISYRTFYFRGSWDNDGFYNAGWDCSFSPMRDDGVAPDEVAGDGIFTGSILLATDTINTYNWAVYCENYNDDASRLQYGENFNITDPGTPPTVPVLNMNPSGSEHNFTLTAEDISGQEFDLTPGYNGEPNMWSATAYMPAGYTFNYRIKVMRTDDVAYGEGGIGGERISFTPPVNGNYTIYFDDNEDLASTGANLVITPNWLEVDLTPSDTTNRQFTLINNGVLDLSFQIPDDFNLTYKLSGQSDNNKLPDPGPMTSYRYNGPKPANENTPSGPPVILGSGGPDDYGYKWIDSDEQGGPTFQWVDITGIGTPISMSDDDNEGPFTLPFDFKFYENEYNSFRICSNGWISFTSTSTQYTNDPLPSADAPENLVAPMWDDLNPSTGGQVYYYITSDSAVVSWINVPHYYHDGSYSFQIVLLRGGIIFYNYLSLNGDVNSATVGIQNATKDDGLQVAYNANYLHDNLTVRIAAGWLEVSPLTGIIPAGGQMTISAAFDASALSVGDYSGTITVTSWDTLHSLPDMEVPVSLHILDNLPILSLAMQPNQSPVNVHPGGSFDYTVVVANNTGNSVNYDGWLMLTLPDETVYGPLANINTDINGNATQYYYPTQAIPTYAPLGSYTYSAYVGDYPSTVYDEASFPFEVIGGTIDGGADEWRVDGFSPDNTVESTTELPMKYSLAQNYPNPFNAHSVIEYALPVGSKVELSVYNLLGQKVITLVNGYQEAGYHSINWDASHYSSGIYFYKLIAGDYVSTKTMALIK